MTQIELANLLKTWNTRELHKTLISYGIRFRKYQSQKKDNIYLPRIIYLYSDRNKVTF